MIKTVDELLHPDYLFELKNYYLNKSGWKISKDDPSMVFSDKPLVEGTITDEKSIRGIATPLEIFQETFQINPEKLWNVNVELYTPVIHPPMHGDKKQYEDCDVIQVCMNPNSKTYFYDGNDIIDMKDHERGRVFKYDGSISYAHKNPSKGLSLVVEYCFLK